MCSLLPSRMRFHQLTNAFGQCEACDIRASGRKEHVTLIWGQHTGTQWSIMKRLLRSSLPSCKPNSLLSSRGAEKGNGRGERVNDVCVAGESFEPGKGPAVDAAVFARDSAGARGSGSPSLLASSYECLWMSCEIGLELILQLYTLTQSKSRQHNSQVMRFNLKHWGDFGYNKRRLRSPDFTCDETLTVSAGCCRGLVAGHTVKWKFLPKGVMRCEQRERCREAVNWISICFIHEVTLKIKVCDYPQGPSSLPVLSWMELERMEFKNSSRFGGEHLSWSIASECWFGGWMKMDFRYWCERVCAVSPLSQLGRSPLQVRSHWHMSISVPTNSKPG